VGKVVKGAIIGFGFMLTAGALAFVAPAIFVNATFWTFAQNLALGAFLSGVSAQLAGKNRGARAQTEVEYAGTVEPRRIIYGELLVSGMHVIPPLTSGSNNKMLHVVLALAGHEVNAIGDVYFGQDRIESADIGAITGSANDGLVSDGDYEDRAWIRRYRGTSTQTADYILNTAFSAWTNDHRGRGIAYIAVQFQYDEEVYKTGKPEITCMVQGKKCYDPRLDSSPGANPTNASYIAYTNNPALCLADYLTDDALGLGEDPARIDWDMVSDAADICDELVDVPTGATQARYTCNIALLATTPYENNIEALAACMLGSCLYSGGKWRMRAGAWETPSFEITADNVMNGGIQVSTAYPYKERWNGIRGSYIDPNNRYQPNEFPAVQDDDYVIEDGESVFKDMAFSGCTNVYEAQRNAIMLVRKSRNKRSAIIQCDLSAFRIRPGDTGIVTLAELGWTNQQVRCEGWKINPAGSIEIAVREESSDDWNDPLESDYTEPLAISTPAPAYFIPEAPSGLTATGVPRAINFTWTAPTLVPTGSRYELYEYTSSTPFSSATKVWEGVSTGCRLDKSDATTRYYWVRLVTADGQSSVEHPTSAAGVAGASQRTYVLDSDGPNDGTFGTSAISGPANWTDDTAAATVSWANTTGGDVEVEFSYSILVRRNGSDGTIFYRVYGQTNLGVVGTPETVMLIPYVADADAYTHRSGVFSVTVPNGVTFTGTVRVGLIVPSGVSATPPGVAYKDAKARVTALVL
jgi:hypothetical protein